MAPARWERFTTAFVALDDGTVLLLADFDGHLEAVLLTFRSTSAILDVVLAHDRCAADAVRTIRLRS